MSEGDTRASKRPTVKQVAHAAGVSVATVSYVLSGRRGRSSGVSEGTRLRVTDAAAELGYRPNRTARAMRTGRTGVIQLALHMLSDPWSIAIAERVTRFASERGFSTFILPDYDWRSALERVECDAAYLAVDTDFTLSDERRALARFAQTGPRLIVYNGVLEPDGYDVIRFHDTAAATIAMRHLLESHTQIACLAKVQSRAGTVGPRVLAYRAELVRAGITALPQHMGWYSGTVASSFAAAVELLSTSPRPTAVYAETDFAGIAAIHAAHFLGLSVPADVAIIGTGNAPDSEDVVPSLSSVGSAAFADRLAEMLIARASGADSSEGHLVELQLSLFHRNSS